MDIGTKDSIVFYYLNMTGTESYCDLLKDWFRRSGHKRPIVFKTWNCYDELPGTDADLIAYDAVVLSSLADKGLLRPVPDSISADDAFPWVNAGSKYRNKTYGVPVMMCSNALICREKDDQHVVNVMELNEKVAIPMRSMLVFFFIQAFCTNLNIRKSLNVLDHLLDLIGGRDHLVDSSLAVYDGIGRFNREECRYFLGFTESIRDFNKDEYMVTFANFSENKTQKRPLFMVDYVSLGKNAPDEKLEDCLELMKIMVNGDFVYDVCTLDGKLQYLLPANRSVFPRLAEIDPIYRHLYRQLGSDENGVLRYSRRFYENYETQREVLLQFLWERAGFKPSVS